MAPASLSPLQSSPPFSPPSSLASGAAEQETHLRRGARGGARTQLIPIASAAATTLPASRSANAPTQPLRADAPRETTAAADQSIAQSRPHEGTGANGAKITDFWAEESELVDPSNLHLLASPSPPRAASPWLNLVARQSSPRAGTSGLEVAEGFPCPVQWGASGATAIPPYPSWDAPARESPDLPGLATTAPPSRAALAGLVAAPTGASTASSLRPPVGVEALSGPAAWCVGPPPGVWRGGRSTDAAVVPSVRDHCHGWGSVAC